MNIEETTRITLWILVSPIVFVIVSVFWLILATDDLMHMWAEFMFRNDVVVFPSSRDFTEDVVDQFKDIFTWRK